MVSARLDERTPDLIPVPPSWMQRQQEQGAPSQNRNINDIYWKKPDGWIIVGPSAVLGANNRPLTAQAEGLMRRGYVPLVDYSYTDRVSDKTGHRETIETNADRLGTPDRYYWLFRNGGAHLFPIEQIVEHHWHITPPYGLPKSVFPQLDEWDVPDPRWCPTCIGRAPMNSDEQVITHLILMHQPMTGAQARELLQFAGEPPRGSGGVAIRRKVAAAHESAVIDIEKALAEAKPRKLIMCDECGEGPFPDGLAKGRHVKAVHKTADASPVEGREDNTDGTP